ncbi:MAG TPA: SIS domain-containing protein [Caldithrix abyssi]|uniref:Phosphoheptose isomerase n=1 Tax=Caldithrix abyssi TaxID=187145 RepID=A0A7V4U0I7_CALAY|nr:SIS domain-containing protein [Caldithrix abyssi]
MTSHLQESAATKQRIIEHCLEDIEQAVHLLQDSLKAGGKLLLCGNGGSAADAQHIAAEFVVRLSKDLQRPAIAAIALTTDTSLLTAAGNDIGFDNIFARQVEALGKENDTLIGITTSGNSTNVILAAKEAKKIGMSTIGFLGQNTGEAKELFDISIHIPSKNTQHIQEGHITVGHIICELVERSMFDG